MKQLIFYTGLVPPGLFLDRVRTCTTLTAIHTHTHLFLPSNERSGAR